MFVFDREVIYKEIKAIMQQSLDDANPAVTAGPDWD
jgi:hypothetical protein